jgi:nucleoside-diphosphate-sugar epimerase
MRIFITGASGWIGKELVPELLHHGHSVLALARSPLSAQSLRDQGAEIVQGSISDIEVLKSSAAASDAVIHLAFVANFENMAEDCATEREQPAHHDNGHVLCGRFRREERWASGG